MSGPCCKVKKCLHILEYIVQQCIIYYSTPVLLKMKMYSSMGASFPEKQKLLISGQECLSIASRMGCKALDSAFFFAAAVWSPLSRMVCG